MKRILIVVALFASACSGNPAGPSSPVPAPVVATVQPAPAAPPTEEAPVATAPAPVPAPAPPAPPAAVPEPVPTPAPVKPAPARELYDGETAGGHWYGPARIAARFTLEVTGGALMVDGAAFPILSRSDGITTAGAAGVETLTIRSTNGAWSWTYNGLAGQAFGSLEARK